MRASIRKVFAGDEVRVEAVAALSPTMGIASSGSGTIDF